MLAELVFASKKNAVIKLMTSFILDVQKKKIGLKQVKNDLRSGLK